MAGFVHQGKREQPVEQDEECRKDEERLNLQRKRLEQQRLEQRNRKDQSLKYLAQ